MTNDYVEQSILDDQTATYLKSEQPDDFLEELKQYFNVSNDEECQVEKCWLCGHD